MADLPTGPKKLRSTVLTVEQEAVIVAFRKHTLLPLDDSFMLCRPSIFTAVQEQLGLKLERQMVPVDVFVIDHVEQPSAN